MKKFKVPTLPKNCLHASGIFRAKSILVFPKIVLATILIIALIISKISTDESVIEFLFWSAVLILVTFISGYITGRTDKKEVAKYLSFLRKKYNEQVKSLEDLDSKTENMTNEEIALKKEKIKDFFRSSISKFTAIKTTEDGTKNHFKEAMDHFNLAMRKARSRSIKKAGAYLEELFISMFDAIHDKKTFVFDPNWVNEIDLSEERNIVYEHIFHCLCIEKEELIKLIDILDILIENLPKEVYKQ